MPRLPRMKRPTSYRDDLLSKLCFISLGEYLPTVIGSSDLEKAFFLELTNFHRIGARAKTPKITAAAIRQWRRGAKPHRSNALEFLHGYLYWIRTYKADALEKNTDIQHIFKITDEYLNKTRGQSYLRPNEIQPKAREQVHQLPLPPEINIALKTMMGISVTVNRSEADAFFRDSKRSEMDRSFYILYRFSTNHGAVVKSFLVIDSHGLNSGEIFTYRHFVWSGQSPRFRNQVFRECEGVIMKMERSFYFIGYNYIVPVNKRNDFDLYRLKRMASRWKPDGLGCLAFEYDDVYARPDLFGGLTLTVADLAQPVAGRVAMLRIGTSSVLGRDLTDVDVQPGEIALDDLSNDLKVTTERLRKLGIRCPWSPVGTVRHGVSSNDVVIEDLSKSIIDMIDNTPYWDRSMTRSRAKGARVSRGALEAPGSGRPRN